MVKCCNVVCDILSNIYLDKLDKELEARGLRFCRYADDCVIFVKSEAAANRVMESICWWIERKLFLRVNATKTKVVRPMNCTFLGFTFWKNREEWECRPLPDRKKRLEGKVKEALRRRYGTRFSLGEMTTKVNQIVKGWINYYSLGFMKSYLKNEFGPWLRHRYRMIILMQWKKPRTIFANLKKINIMFACGFSDEEIFKVANTRRGRYAQANGNVINFILSPKVLAMGNRKRKRPGLVDPLQYYIVKHQRFA